MTIFIWNMIRTKRIGLLSLIGLLLAATACSSGGLKNGQHAPAVMHDKHLDSAIVTSDSSFLPQAMDESSPSHRASADFNHDGLADVAFILRDGNEWKLIVLLQTESGAYSSNEITTFPGADHHWKSIPANKVRIYPIVGTGKSTDRLGLAIDGMTSRLEYYWSEKFRDFVASRIHADVSDSAAFKGEVVLRALDLDRNEQADPCLNAASCLDIDRQSTDKGKAADLMFTKGRGTMTFYSLKPVNGATAAPFGKPVPTHDDCRLQQHAMSNGSMPEVELGMHFCVLTNEKNLAHVWIQSIDPNHEVLTLGLDLWPSDH